MKAALLRQFGGPDVLEYSDLPEPSAGEGEVVIRVKACGINRYDLYMRMGAVFTDIAFPHVLGADVCGEVVETGSGVDNLAVGDRVVMAPGYPIDKRDWDVRPENMADSFEVKGTHTHGGNAEFVVAPERFVLPFSADVPDDEVAAMPLVLMTAVHAVETLGEVRPGQRVLVQAGASGSGHVCVQVARALGARVATTVGSDEKLEFVRSVGAELVMNRRSVDVEVRLMEWTEGSGADVVIDNIGAAAFETNMRVLRKGGIFVNFGLVGGMKATLDIRHLFFSQHQLRGSFMGSMDELRRGLAMLSDGTIRAHVDRRFPLEGAGEAHAYIESRAVRGKVVLIPPGA